MGDLCSAEYIYFRSALHTFWCSLCAMRLHCHMRIEMVQSTISFLAAVPAALIHTLDFFVTSTRSLVLLRAWNGYEGVHSGQRMTALTRC